MESAWLFRHLWTHTKNAKPPEVRHARQQTGQVDRHPAVELLELLSVAIISDIRVIAMTDRGLKSHNLCEKIYKLGWHPYMRQSINTRVERHWLKLSLATPLTLARGSRAGGRSGAETDSERAAESRA